MTRVVALLVAAGLAVIALAMASVLGRNDFAGASVDPKAFRAGLAVSPLSNREGKADRLEPADEAKTLAPVADDETPAIAPAPVSGQVRDAFAAGTPMESTAANLAIQNIPGAVKLPTPVEAGKPKVANKPLPPQKNYTLLSDAQIAAIRNRLRLSPAQETHWPGVETALRAIARRMHDKRLAQPANGAPAVDIDSPEVAQLQTAAMPLLMQLREDQKREVRALARVIGLEAVAARI